MSAYKRNQSNGPSKKLFIVLGMVGLLIVAAVILKLRTVDNQTTYKPSADGKPVNLSPPTEQEKSETEAYKESLAQPPQNPASNTGKKAVTPVITNASKREVNAYVPGVFEEGGTCMATLTKGDKTVTKTSKGFGNVSYTSCEPISVDGLLENGAWTVVVSYGSAGAEGKSGPKVFTVE